MFNLSTQEVVLSIEKAELKVVNGLVYQEYPNFFGKFSEEDFEFNDMLAGKKNKFKKLENQKKLNRKKLADDDKDLKRLKIFFMNSQITKALENKFRTKLKFDSIDLWIDGKGYKLKPHVDDPRIKLHLQVYLSDNNEGTSLYNNKSELMYTFPFRANFGYALLNNIYSRHGVEEIEEDGRTSLYVRYQ